MFNYMYVRMDYEAKRKAKIGKQREEEIVRKRKRESYP